MITYNPQHDPATLGGESRQAMSLTVRRSTAEPPIR